MIQEGGSKGKIPETSSVVIEAGFGPRHGRTYKATACGISSAVLPAALFDTPGEFGALKNAGSSLGSGGFIVFDDAANMPRVAQAMARFLYLESCNQCHA